MMMLEKDQNTYLYAIDSSKTTDNVTWHRIDKDQNEINTWIRALGIQMNIINRGTEIFNDNYQFQIPIWTTANRLLEKNRKSIAAHITWKSSMSNELVTCIAILDRFNDLGMLPVTSNLKYKSYLLNINKDVFPFLGTVNHDSIASQLDQIAIESWKVTNQSIPATINFTFQESDWWGQSNYTNIRGVNALLLVMDKDTLQISILAQYKIELWIAALLLLIIAVVFVLRKNRSKSSSINNYINSQNTDIHASELIQKGESSHLEFKSSFRFDYVQNKVNKDLEYVIAKSIAAFSNGRGGTLLIGVNDDGKVLGIENDILTLKRKDVDFFENNLRMFLNKVFSVGYVTNNLMIKFPVVNHKVICRIDVNPGQKPVFIEMIKNSTKSERFYVRSGNTSMEVSVLSEINKYIQERF
jgi:hypothetical protein